MTSCNVDHSDHRNNGLITKIWGGPAWTFTHAITYGYPIEPNEEQKQDYKTFFISMGKVLPCRYCRESYQKFITTGETALTDEVLASRKTLTVWYKKVHDTVNNKLGIDYGITQEDLDHRFESFRARCDMTDPAIKGCTTPLDYKAFSYRKLNQMDCPIVSLEVSKLFIEMARIRGIQSEYFVFLELVYELNGNITELKKQSAWEERNHFCQKQIKLMRETAISSIETEGEWKGTPTIEELKLFLFLCSNLNRDEISNCAMKLAKKGYCVDK